MLRLKDPEELRHDRATKISRKELADLMAELLDCGNEANMVIIISSNNNERMDIENGTYYYYMNETLSI